MQLEDLAISPDSMCKVSNMGKLVVDIAGEVCRMTLCNSVELVVDIAGKVFCVTPGAAALLGAALPPQLGVLTAGLDNMC